MKFVKDIFSEEVAGLSEGGKFSAKRFMGIIVGVGALLGSIASGFHFYEISQEIINPMWIFSGGMLGISILKGITK